MDQNPKDIETTSSPKSERPRFSNKSNPKSKLDFNEFFIEPINFLTKLRALSNYSNLQKSLLGVCSRRNDLGHALLLISDNLRSNINAFDHESKNILMNMIVSSVIPQSEAPVSSRDRSKSKIKQSISSSAAQGSLKDPRTVSLESLLEFLPAEARRMNFEPERLSQSLYDLTLEIVNSPKEPEERISTLAIRFFCSSLVNDYNKALKIYERLRKSGVKPHNRTFMPLIKCCNSSGHLMSWHEKVLAESNTSCPSLEFYESFFERLMELDRHAIIDQMEIYQNSYQYITPKLASIFKKHLKHLEDMRIGKDGLVYQKTGRASAANMPIFKLEAIDISYVVKRKFAQILWNTKSRAYKYRSNTNLSDEEESDQCDVYDIDQPRLSPSLSASSSSSASVKRGGASEPEFKTNAEEMGIFEQFVQDRNLVWDVVIDGANVARYANSQVFRFDRILSLVKHLCLNYHYKVLVILNSSHQTYEAEEVEEWIKRNQTMSCIYYTPRHHGDDHFWMYAALTRDAFILTNDEMRDHGFLFRQNLEENSENPKGSGRSDELQIWRERHQIFFNFQPNDMHLEKFHVRMPKKFSQVIQIDYETRQIHAPVYDAASFSMDYIENLDKTLGWISFQG